MCSKNLTFLKNGLLDSVISNYFVLFIDLIYLKFFKIGTMLKTCENDHYGYIVDNYLRLKFKSINFTSY